MWTLRDLTFRKELDGRYHAEIDTALALYGDEGVSGQGSCAHASKWSSRRNRFRVVPTHGFDYTLSLALPKPGCYQLRA